MKFTLDTVAFALYNRRSALLTARKLQEVPK